MPSPFETRMSSAFDRLYGSFAKTGFYTSPNGDKVFDISIRVRSNDSRQVVGQSKTIGESQSGTLFVRQSELARPVKGGRFTVENVDVWTIESTPTLKNGQFECTCTRASVAGAMDRRTKENA